MIDLQVQSVAVPGVIPVAENRQDGPDVATIYIPGPAGISVLAAAAAAQASAAAAQAAAESIGSADPAGTAAAAMASHVAASDPHGDRAYADSLVTGLWDDRGNYDASGGAYPSTGGSGTAGAIKKGDIWTISVAGTLPTTQAVEPGDTVRALVDAPGQTQGNWAIAQNNIGYTPENSSNKSTDTALGGSDTLYPSQKAVRNFVNNKLDVSQSITMSHKFFAATSITSTSIPYRTMGAGYSEEGFLTYSDLDTITGVAALLDAKKILLNTNSINSASGIKMSGLSSGSTNLSQPRWRTGDRFQWLFSLAFQERLPGAGNDFVYRVGVSHGTSSATLSDADPFSSPVATTTQDGFAAFFQISDDSTYIQCLSGQAASTETTTTSVLAALNWQYVFRIVIETNGVVRFYIDGNLVATHSGAGVAPNNVSVADQIGIRNLATTTNALKAVVIDEIAKRYTLGVARTGFSFD